MAEIINSLKDILNGNQKLTDDNFKFNKPSDFEKELDYYAKHGQTHGTTTHFHSLDPYLKWRDGFFYGLTGYPGCFYGGQKVHTKSGVKCIKDIKAGEYVLSHNHKNKVNEWRMVTDTHKFKEHKDRLFEIKLKDGTKIRVTENHEFFNGHKYVKIKDILLSLNKK